MPYQIQIKAVERPVNLGKFILSLFKNILAVSTAVIPPILTTVSLSTPDCTATSALSPLPQPTPSPTPSPTPTPTPTPPTTASPMPLLIPLTITIACFGYFGYLAKQAFEIIENEQQRKKIIKHRQAGENFINTYNQKCHELGYNNDMLDIAETGLYTSEHYTFFRPSFTLLNFPPNSEQPRHSKPAFGESGREKWSFILFLAQLALITAAFVISIIQEVKDEKACLNVWDVWTPLLFGTLGAIIDPFAEHVKKANLTRTLDTYTAVLYALYRPVSKGKQIMGAVPDTNRNFLQKKFSQLTHIKPNATVKYSILSKADDNTRALIVNPARYYFCKANILGLPLASESQPEKIVEIVRKKNPLSTIVETSKEQKFSQNNKLKIGPNFFRHSTDALSNNADNRGHLDADSIDLEANRFGETVSSRDIQQNHDATPINSRYL